MLVMIDLNLRAKNCNSLKDLRRAAQKRPEFREETLDCIAPVKAMLNGIFCRLNLKEKPIGTSIAAREQDIKAMWNALSGIMNSIPAQEDLHKKSNLEKAPST